MVITVDADPVVLMLLVIGIAMMLVVKAYLVERIKS